MTAPAFDPLREFYGQWNTALAERYLPLPDLPNAEFECVHGRLVMTPAESTTNTGGEAALIRLFYDNAVSTGHSVYTTMNLTLDPVTWIHPDGAVLHSQPQSDDDALWVPAALCTMVIEFTSKSSVYRDRIDKPAICAAGGVPYFMWVELKREPRAAEVRMGRLVDGSYETFATARAGQQLVVDEPFPIAFDPGELLLPVS